MVITKREDVTKQGFCKIVWKKTSVFGRVSYYLLFEFECEWVLINFFCLYDGRLFKVGANSTLGAYLNKYGILEIDARMI